MRGVFWVLSIAFLLSFGSVSAATIGYAGTCAQENVLVCGSTPDSLTGHGGVDLCNICYPCGVADGVCPEDFYSSVTEQQGSCSGCPDPDCIATMAGTVRTEVGELVPNANVFALYENWTGQTVRQIATTDANGAYSVNDLPSGFLNFFVEYEDFESPTITQRIIRGQSQNLDFQVQRGSCNADCTGTVGNRCLASCQGVNTCSFSSNSDFSSDEIATLCNQKLPGERIVLDVDGRDVTHVTCCSGPIETETRSRVDVGIGDNAQISNLVSYVQRARLNGEQVQLVVTTWDTE